MSVRKNISLDKTHLKKLEPLVTKHKGNFSAAMREIIDLVDAFLQNPESMSRLIDGLKSDQNLKDTILEWFLQQNHGRLIDQDTLNVLIDPSRIRLMTALESHINELISRSYWHIKVSITGFDDNTDPTRANVTLDGNNEFKIDFLAGIVGSFLAKNKKLGISSVLKRAGTSTIDFESRKTAAQAYSEVVRHFGHMDEIAQEIADKPDFWKCIVNLYKQTNYNMVTIPKNYYNELLVGKESPTYLTTPIEAIHKTPIEDIQLERLIATMKSVYGYMGIVEKIDVDDDTLYIYHGYTDAAAVAALDRMLRSVLNANGHAYSSRCSKNLIVMKPAGFDRIDAKNASHAGIAVQ